MLETEITRNKVFMYIYRHFRGMFFYIALLTIASRVSDIVNFFVTAFIVMDNLKYEYLGAIGPVNNLVNFIAVPLAVILVIPQKYVNTFAARGELNKARKVAVDSLLLVCIYLCFVSVIMSLIYKPLFIRMKIPSIFFSLVIMIVVAVFTVIPRLLWVIAQARKAFVCIGLATSIPPVVRMVTLVFSINRLDIYGYLLGFIVAGITAGVILSYPFINLLRNSDGSSYRELWGEIGRYSIGVGTGLFFINMVFFIEVLAIRNFGTELESAAFFVIQTTGSIAMYIPSAVVVVLFPLVSERHESGKESKILLMIAFFVTLVAGLIFALILFLTADNILLLRSSWSKFINYSNLLAPMAVVYTIQGVILIYISYSNAVQDLGYLYWLVPLSLFGGVGIYSALGWGAFKQFVPDIVWGYIAEIFKDRVLTVVAGMFVWRFIALLFITIRIFKKEKFISAFYNNPVF